MPEHEARARAVYDHTDEEPRRRRRQVADWGVGEELFDHTPRGRRFGRERGERHEDIPRGGAEDGRRTIVIGDEETALPPVREQPADEEFASREEALRAREADDALWGGDEPFARAEQAERGDERFARAEQAERGDEPFARDEVEPAAEGGGEPVTVDEPGQRVAVSAPYARGPQGGRRTVKIGGRPGELQLERPRRPPKTVSERVGPRPDRVAAWAFALGLLLILIALLS